MTESIRRAAESDLDEALRLLKELGYRDLERDSFAQAFAEALTHPEIVVLVAEDSNGRLLGLASLSHRPQLRLAGIVVTLDELVVDSGARGTGVGRKLLDEVRTFARGIAARRLELQTNRSRESYKRGFYLKNGFVEANSAVLRWKEDK
jgi:GNAT superfamily N-acetyltransferase